jgi:hypothetical protein
LKIPKDYKKVNSGRIRKGDIAVSGHLVENAKTLIGKKLVGGKYGSWIIYRKPQIKKVVAKSTSTNKGSKAKAKIAALALYCVGCGEKFEFGWNHCPRCGRKRQLLTT